MKINTKKLYKEIALSSSSFSEIKIKVQLNGLNPRSDSGLIENIFKSLGGWHFQQFLKKVDICDFLFDEKKVRKWLYNYWTLKGVDKPYEKYVVQNWMYRHPEFAN